MQGGVCRRGAKCVGILEKAEWGWLCISQVAVVYGSITGHRRCDSAMLLSLRYPPSAWSLPPPRLCFFIALGSPLPFTAQFSFLSFCPRGLCYWPGHSHGIFQFISLAYVYAWTPPGPLGSMPAGAPPLSPSFPPSWDEAFVLGPSPLRGVPPEARESSPESCQG